jgi:hypothetical protein
MCTLKLHFLLTSTSEVPYYSKRITFFHAGNEALNRQRSIESSKNSPSTPKIRGKGRQILIARKTKGVYIETTAGYTA